MKTVKPPFVRIFGNQIYAGMRNILLLILTSSIAFCQQTENVDFKKINASIEIDTSARKVIGKVLFEAEIKQAVDTIFIDAIDMTFSDMTINGKWVEFKSDHKKLKLFQGYRSGKNIIEFAYEARPRQTMYFTGKDETYQIWTQGQGKYTSHWLPSFDDVNEKLVFQLSIGFDSSFTVLSNGVLKNRKTTGNTTSWSFQMKKPMSSYLVMLAIGKFAHKKSKASSGVPLEMYYHISDADKVGPTYRHTERIFNYLEKEIGVKYPWQIYKQVPVRDFLYAGMENTTATVFAQDFVVDETGFNDRNYINVNAHELAHQWFGDLVTAASGKHHWLQEGFATYYALLSEKEVFGTDYFNYQLYNMAVDLRDAAKAGDTIPILNEKASSLTFYRKGAWALHVLRTAVGESHFRKAVKSYLKKHSFQNVVTEDFLTEINKVSDFNTDAFVRDWLSVGGFRYDEAITLLRKNAFMEKLLTVHAMSSLPFEEKRDQFTTVLKSDAYHPIKEEIIYQIQDVPYALKQDLIKAALDTGSIEVRQAVARTMAGIPLEAYPIFVTLLDDKSYITKEIAINMLYGQFIDRRFEILDKTDKVIGFNDRNLRTLWLTLALSTDNYRNERKVNYYDELIRYAGADYEATVRQNALEKLLYLNPDDVNVLRLMIPPLTHHRWQFSKFARDKIRELIKTDKYRKFYLEQLSKIDGPEKMQLQRLLG